jgi:hypothetical protein
VLGGEIRDLPVQFIELVEFNKNNDINKFRKFIEKQNKSGSFQCFFQPTGRTAHTGSMMIGCLIWNAPSRREMTAPGLIDESKVLLWRQRFNWPNFCTGGML